MKKKDTRLSFRDRRSFRAWLKQNHSKTTPVWIEYYKDGTPGITYRESLEEALCFGWIDSIIKKIDEKIYVRKFTPRRSKSRWSEINKNIVEKLIRNGRMTRHGLAKIMEAKKNGRWLGTSTGYEKTLKPEGIRPMLVRFRKIVKAKGGNEMLGSFDHKGEKTRILFARYFFEAKNEETKKRRIIRIFEVINGKRQIL